MTPPVLPQILDGSGQTWGPRYWTIWLLVMASGFLAAELYALASGQGPNTLSAYVWRALKITNHQPIGGWSATDFLVFGLWMVLLIWLTFHFFFGLFH